MPPAMIDTASCYAGCLAGVRPARVGAARWATVIDGLPLASAALVAVSQRQAGRDVDLRWTLLMIAAFLCIQGILLVGWGRSLGRWLLRLRTVDDLTGLPVTGRALLTGLTRDRRIPRMVTADLTRGRDPLAPLPPAEPAVTLVFDTGRRHVVSGSLLIGRNPANSDVREPSDSDHPLLAMADPSQSLERTHALLEWSDLRFWVTDLHSGHGSVLVGLDGERHPLQPGVRTSVETGWTVQCGQRFFSVHDARPPRAA